MALYCHITQTCAEHIKNIGLWDKAQSFKKKVEIDQRVSPITFPPNDGFKAIGQLFRFCFRVISAPSTENNDVVVLHSVLRTPEPEWTKWRKDLDFRNDLFEKCYRADILESEMKIRVLDAAKTGFQPPTPNEAVWLNPMWQGSSGKDIWFLETEEWVDALNGPTWKGRAIDVCRVLASFSPLQWKDSSFRWHENCKVGIVYRYYPEHNYVLLLNLLNSNTPPKETNAPDSGTQDSIRSYARRAYTEEILADAQTWLTIIGDEDAKEANLALSGEELQVLDSVKFPPSGKPRFPIFINGRAGSGKSTLLLYLLGDYIQMQLDRLKVQGQDSIGIPLYLTCSTALKQRASELTHKLVDLRGNRAGIQSGSNPKYNPSQAQYLKRVLTDGFQVFHEFLRSCLPERERKRFDDPDKYISYSVFRRLWDKRCERDRRLAVSYHADLVWHFLRTYVKGMRPDAEEWLDPEYYESTLDKKHRTIGVDLYRELYDRVWSWYRDLCDGSGYWDDQDLTIAFLEHGDTESKQYPAIFCDEAQDFTKIEIEAILRLSLFMHRRLDAYQLRDVPLAFAGDPLQTLNPTGFRWASVKSQLYQSLAPLSVVQSQSSTSTIRPTLNFAALENNYRSAPPIVDFCNIILALRSVVLKTEDVTPQLCWWPRQEKDYREVLAYDLEQARRICEVEGTVILVDCPEGGETQYVSEDTLLNEIVRKDKETGVPQNVLSPMRAKGLEFNRVVLYRFGGVHAEGLRQLMSKCEQYDVERHLPVEYYMNRLYVAASRAKRLLFVIDERTHIDGFWSFARNNKFLKGWEGFNDNEWDIKQFMVSGDDISRDSTSEHSDSPHELAEKFRTQGQAQQDPTLLRRARMYYEQDGNTNNASLCLAQALYLEGEYLKAGKEYANSREPEKAVDAYWRADAGLSEIIKLADIYPDIISRIKYKAAAYEELPRSSIQHNNQGRELIRDLVAHVHERKESDFSDFIQLLRDNRWHGIIERALCDILEDSNDVSALATSDWECIAKLRDLGFPIKIEQYAELSYRAGKYREAVKSWNTLTESRRPHRYYRALAETQQSPERLESFAKAKEFRRVVEEYEQLSSGISLNERYRALVAVAYDRTCLSIKSNELVDSIDSADTLHSVFREYCSEPISSDFRTRVVLRVLEGYAQDGNWREFVMILRPAGRNILLPQNQLDVNQQKVIDRRALEILASTETVKFDTDVTKLMEGYIELLLTGEEHPESKKWSSVHWKDVCNGLSVHLVGFAIESILKLHIAALNFYEVIENARWVSREEREFACIRLVKTRTKYAERLQSDGHQEEAERQRERTDSFRKRYPWIPERIDDFPKLVFAQANKAQVDNHDTVRVGNELYSVKYNEGGTVIIEFPGLEGRLRLDVQEYTAISSKELKLEKMDSGKRWRCIDWDLQVSILDGKRIRLTNSDHIDTILQFPEHFLL